MSRKHTELNNIEEVEKQIDILNKQYKELDKEYMEYKEADMNREAGRVASKKYKVSLEIDSLNSKIKLKKLVEKERKDKTIAMQKRIDKYEEFLTEKGLINEFEQYESDLNNQEEEEEL